MDESVDIHKAGGVLILNRHFLVTRSRGKRHFIAPGGKLETGESAEQALIRELSEELGIVVDANDLSPFGTFFAAAAGAEHLRLRSDIYLVHAWRGEISPGHEIEEVRWITSVLDPDFELGSIFLHEVLPRLKEQDLIQ